MIENKNNEYFKQKCPEIKLFPQFLANIAFI